jgi:hypothetical protein
MRSAPVRLEGLPVRRGLTVLVLLASGALIAAGCGGRSNDCAIHPSMTGAVVVS